MSSKNLWKRFTDLFAKEAGALSDWARQEEAEHMNLFHGKMSKAMEGMAGDHPAFGVLKEMESFIASCGGVNKSDDTPSEESPVVPPVETPAETPPAEPPVVEKAAETPTPPVEPPVVEEVAKREVELEKRLRETEEILKSEREVAALSNQVTELKKFTAISVNPEVDAVIFKRMSETDKPTYDRIMEILKSAEAVAEAGKLLTTELGSSQNGGTGKTAWDQIESEATELRKNTPAVTQHQAIDIVMKRRPDLVRKYQEENQ